MTAEWLAFWTTTALIGVLLTAVLLTLTNNWRASLLALGAQYLFAAGLLALVVIWQIAAVLALVGLLVVLILMLAGRQVNFGQVAMTQPGAAVRQTDRFGALRRIEFQTNLPFRLVAVALAAVAVGTVIGQPGETLPGLPESLALSGVWLIALGVLNLGFTDEPMNAGMALLTALSGVTLLYVPVELARTVVVLLAAVNLGVALSVGYLTSLRYGEAGQEGGE